MKRLIQVMIFVLVMTVLIPPAVALALDAPESMNIQSAHVFCNLAEDGDMAIIFHYRIKYPSYSGLEPSAMNSIIFRLFSENGALLSISRPYVFPGFETKGYGDGLSCFYFADGEAPTWGAAYEINILGVQAYYNPIQTSSYTLTSVHYSSAVTQSDSQNDFYNKVIALCDIFGDFYPNIPLKATTDSGIVLSVYGESYLRSAMPNIHTLCPQLFLIQSYVPEKLDVEPYDMSLQETYSGRLAGTDIKRGADRMGVKLGVSGYFILGFTLFLVCVAVCIICIRKDWGVEPGLLISVGIIIGGALLVGNLMFTIAMIMGLVAALGIVWVFVLKRA